MPRSLHCLLALSVLACTEAELTPMASQVPPPSSSLVLQMDPLVPGASVAISVSGAAPGQLVEIVRSTGGLGAGGCPPFLGGNCMDILPAYTLTLSGVANSLGVASWVVPSFPALPPLDLYFQAVVRDGGNSNESNPLYRPVTTACVDDGFEDNDSAATAAPLPNGLTAALGACDEDFYLVSVPAGEAVSVRASFDHEEGDLDLFLLSGPSTVLDSGLSTSDDEYVSWLNTTGGTANLRVRVQLYDDPGAPGVPYDLDVRVAPPAACAADTFEPDDDPTAASPLSPAGAAAVSCDSDEDWFAISVAPGDFLDLTITPDDEDGLVDVALFDPSGAEIDSATQGNPRRVSAPAVAGGVYTLRVEVASDDPLGGGVAYSVDVEVTTPGPCLSDVFEPNNGFGNARLLPGSGMISATGCTTDDDWYRFPVVPGDQVSGVLMHDAMGGQQDVDIYLYDHLGTLVASQDLDLSGTESVRGSSNDAGSWYVRISTESDDALGGGVDYDLSVVIDNLGVCPPDRFEPNDTVAQAMSLAAGSYLDLTACTPEASGGADLFAVTLAAGQTLTATLDFDHGEGDIDVELLDASGDELDRSTTTGDSEVVTTTAGAGTTVYVRAYLFADRGPVLPGNVYDLTLTVQ